jgi:hypothetical protein
MKLIQLLRARGWTDKVRFSVWVRHFSLLHSFQTGSGAHPAYYPTGTGRFSLAVKRPGREADRSSPSSNGATPPLRHASLRREHEFLIKHKSKFTLTDEVLCLIS